MLSEDIETGKSLLRDYINATIGRIVPFIVILLFLQINLIHEINKSG